MNERRKKKPSLLVTGAAGALAQQVIQRLKGDYEIVAVDFRKQARLGKEVTSYEVDFTKRSFEDIFMKHGFEKVIHLGRMLATQTDRSHRYNANVLGTQKLLELCHNYQVKQVTVLSTFHVYGANAYNPALIDEDFPLKAAGFTYALIDSVELENLATIYLWKYPELNITILRPCNIVGPGVRNTISLNLSSRFSPVLTGFSPIMQFIHIHDMADAIVLSSKERHPGIYNVAPADWVSYEDALKRCNCVRVHLPSYPPSLSRFVARVLGLRTFPHYLIDYYRYPVVIDGSRFAKAFDFTPRHSLKEIFAHYRDRKS